MTLGTSAVRPGKQHSSQTTSAHAVELDDPLYDSAGAAQFLCISTKTIEKDRCVPSMKIPFIRIGRCIRYRRSDLVAYIQSNRVDRSTPSHA